MTDTANRPNRAENVRQERRMKPGSLLASGVKLGVNEEALDRNTYSYRWANDTPGRVQQLENQDWDIVSESVKDDADGVGSVQSKVAGTNAGKPYNAVLMRKRKDWHEADQREKQKPLDEVDESIRRGYGHQEASPELRNVAYTPGGQNQISRAS